MPDFYIEPKNDDPQRVLALNGIPSKFYLSALEVNTIVKFLSAILGLETALYKGEHLSIPHLELAHPLPEPGSEAQIIVEGGANLKASWDNTNKKWFLDGLYVAPGSNAAYLLKSVHDTNGNGIIDKAEHIHSVLTAGGTKYYGTRNGVVGVFDLPTGTGGGGSTETLPSGFKVENFTNGYQGGLNWKPFAKYSFNSNSFSASANITIDTSTIPAGQKRLAALVLNSNGTITLVEGEASVNPSAPNIDPATQMIPDGGLIFLSSGAAAPDEISLNRIYTNNSGIAGGEFVASIIFGGARWNLASNEGDGICIKGTELLANDQIRFLPEAAIPIGQFTELVFKIQNLVLTGLTSGGGGFRFVAYGNSVDSRGRVRNSNVLLPSFDTGGFDLTSLAEQFISLKVSALPFYEITELRFVFDHTDPAVVPTILLDEIKYNDGSAPSGENFATVAWVNSELDFKVDKIPGKGLSTEDYTTAEKTKLAGLEVLHKGTHLTLAALQGAYPEGAGQSWHLNKGGWTADVDAGAGADNVRYLWDASDLKWVIQQGTSTAETAESIATKYHSNEGIEAFTTTLLNKVNSFTAIFTTALKASYDTAASWVSTNGQNVLSHLTKWATPQVAGKMPRTLADGSLEWIDTPTGTSTGGIGKIDFGLTGAVDGTNKIFQTSAPFTAGKVLIFLNGIAQTLGSDYTESTTQIIEFIVAPHVGDKIIALY